MNTNGPFKETTIRWQDPTPGLQQVPHLAGIDFLRKVASGELPDAPIAAHVNMTLTHVTAGSVTFESHPDESHINPLGMIHGGFVCTVLDSALGCAVHTTLPAGTGYTSIELKTNFLRPVHPHSAPLTCTGRVTKPGRRVAFAEAEIIDNAGKVVATRNQLPPHPPPERVISLGLDEPGRQAHSLTINARDVGCLIDSGFTSQ